MPEDGLAWQTLTYFSRLFWMTVHSTPRGSMARGTVLLLGEVLISYTGCLKPDTTSSPTTT